MEERSSRYQDIFVPTHDSRLLILRKFAGGKRAVLIIPGLQRSISERWYDDLASHLQDKNTTTYLLEIRGHGLSEGKFSLEHHRKDLRTILNLLHQRFKEIFIIAHDLSASLLLEYPHADGLVLINPLLEHSEGFKLAPVRVQIPVIIFCNQHSEVLKRIFGPTIIHNWSHELESSAGHGAGIAAVVDAVHHLYKQEKPIKFSTRV